MELLGAQVIRLPHDEGQAGRWVGHLVAGVVLLVATALLASWVHVQNITYRYEYSQAYRVQQRRAQIRDALEVERQMLRRPQRIIHIAENELGMRMPSVEERVVFE
jgi:cell division protein FtsL